jgi:uncharacterized protein (DUF1330 family)
MPAYVVVDVTVTDPDKYAAYRELAARSIEAAGARYLARGGDTDVLEGSWEPGRVVVVEFDDAAAARVWYEGAAYAAARAARDGAATMNMVVVEGIPRD